MERRSPSHQPGTGEDAESVDPADDWHCRHAETKRPERGADASIVQESSDDADDWRDRHARVPRT